jgi:hypothetical protein
MKRVARVAESSDRCRFCTHFDNDPQRLEQAIHGLTSLSSAHGSARADDGLCARHDRYVRASYCCSDFLGPRS